MKISDILKTAKHSFSFEFFPPRSDSDVGQLLQTTETLKALNPAYVSVTWGAGGGTRRKTIEIVDTIKRRLGIESMAHLTCVGASKSDLDSILDEVHQRGIENLLPLRGDPPRGDTEFRPHPDGFRYASELVSHVRKRWDFCLGVAGYPEGHPEAANKQEDLEHLKRKVEAGGEFVVTQLFFKNDQFFDFVDRAMAGGIDVPIIAGIMPITNVGQIKRFTETCGATIPNKLLARLDALQDDREAVIEEGIEYATRQCEELLRQGAKGVHFYTLNRSRSSMRILEDLKGLGSA